MAQVVCRLVKLKSFSEIGKVDAHNFRTDGYLHCDPHGPPPIRLIGDGNLSDLVKGRIGVQKLRSNAVIAVELVLSASAVYFRPSAPEAWGKFDQERLDAWVPSQLKWLNDTFGADNVVDLTMHLDEATPHLHAVVVPIRPADGKLAATHWFDGPMKMRALQESAAAAVKHLGIRRGEAFSAAEHQQQQAFYTAAAKPVPEIPEVTALPAPEAEPEPGLVERLIDPAKHRIWQENEEKRKKTDEEHLRQRNARSNAIDAAHETLVQQAKAAETARKLHKAAEAKATHYKRENERLKAESKRLRELDPGDVLVEVYGATEAKDSKAGYKTRKFDIAGLPASIAVTDDLWCDNSSGKGGRGCIDLVQHLSSVDFKAAITILRDSFGADRTRQAAVAIAAKCAESAVDSVPDVTPPMPQRVESRWEPVREWLTQVRKLPGKLVDLMYDKGSIFANQFAGCVFRRDREGYAIRGIGKSTFKQTAGKALACGGFSVPGQGDVWIVEGPIDALSVKAIYPDAHVLALLGASGLPADQVPHEIPPGRRVVLALDNDNAGEARVAVLEKALKGWDVVREKPVRKDWNSDLQEGFKEVAVKWLLLESGSEHVRSPHIDISPSP